MGNFRRIKRILATALSVAMIGTIMPSSVFAASKALTAVKYYSKGALLSCTDYTVVDSSTTELTTGWYVVNTPVTMEERVEVHGDVRIIVARGGAYRLKEGIHVAYGNKLAIFGYGQEEGSFLAY